MKSRLLRISLFVLLALVGFGASSTSRETARADGSNVSFTPPPQVTKVTYSFRRVMGADDLDGLSGDQLLSDTRSEFYPVLNNEGGRVLLSSLGQQCDLSLVCDVVSISKTKAQYGVQYKYSVDCKTKGFVEESVTGPPSPPKQFQLRLVSAIVRLLSKHEAKHALDDKNKQQ